MSHFLYYYFSLHFICIQTNQIQTNITCLSQRKGIDSVSNCLDKKLLAVVSEEVEPRDNSALGDQSAGTPEKIDIISRVMFPILFLVFNLIYWPYYLILIAP